MYYVIGLIILIIIYIFVFFNSVVNLNNKVNEAFSTMDVYLKKRWDLIPSIVEVVKGYASHEKNTLEEIVRLRSQIYTDLSDTDKLATNKKITFEMNKLLALVESYPEIKANEHFMDLSNKLTQIEDDIANSRKYYNAVIRLYNNKIEVFPNNILAKLLNFKSKTMFEINNSERQNVSINI